MARPLPPKCTAPGCVVFIPHGAKACAKHRPSVGGFVEAVEVPASAVPALPKAKLHNGSLPRESTREKREVRYCECGRAIHVRRADKPDCRPCERAREASGERKASRGPKATRRTILPADPDLARWRALVKAGKPLHAAEAETLLDRLEALHRARGGLCDGAERLARWIAENRYTVRRAAKLLGVGHASVRAWLEGRERPRGAMRQRISERTGGKVPGRAWAWPWESRQNTRAEALS